MSEAIAKSIFLSAIEQHQPDQWPTYLDEACADDPGLRDEVERLLRSYRELGEFHEEEADLTVDSLQNAESVGATIGPYKLIEQIGEGGMGAVYMAEQTEPVRRSVALKVIKAGMDTKEVVARFEAERQALALMSHPNIANVLDAGATESGRLYFAMDLVRGVPITDFCDQRKLNVTERLKLFATVCQAIQHAHQKGIIHRDLKPSNILVELHDVIGVPKVIDFGVAKATKQQLTERSLHTGFAQMIGTPLYMSPEQAELSGLDVDTRTDIYSLGVVLYELLSGTTPFVDETLKQAGYDEMRRIIREDTPPKPSDQISTLAAESLSTISAQRSADPRKLSQLIRGELDWVVMKTLEKDRKWRYDSAGALAADVQHYLHDEPVVACPPSAIYRFGKYARRNKVALLMTSLVSVALLVGAVGLAVSNQLIKQERDAATAQRLEAEKQTKVAEAQKKAAEKNYRRARNAVDEYLVKVSENQLLNAPALQPLRRDLLMLALKYYQEFAAEHGDDLELRRETGQAHLKAGNVLTLLHQHEDAEGVYRAAIGIFEKLTLEEPEQLDNRHHLADSQHQLGGLLGALGRLVEQEEAYRRAVDTEEQLVAAFPSEPRYANLLAKCYSSLAGAMLARGQAEETARLVQQAQQASKSAQQDTESDQSTTAAVGQAAGDLQTTLGNLKEAERIYRQSRQLWEKLSRRSPNQAEYRVHLSHSLHGLGGVLVDQGQLSSAMDTLHQAIVVKRQLVRDFPTVPRYKSSLANSLNSLLGESYVRESATIFEQLANDYPHVPGYAEGLAMCLHNLGNSHKDRGEAAQAEERYREALAVHLQLAERFPDMPKYAAHIAISEMCIGLVLSNSPNRWQEAETAFRESLKRYQELSQQFPKNFEYRGKVPYCLGFLGSLLHRMNILDKAEAAYREALAVYEQIVSEVPDKADFDILRSSYVFKLATVLHDLGRHVEAQTQFEAALERSRESVKRHPTSTFAWETWNRAVLSHHSPYSSRQWQGAEVEARNAIKWAAGNPEFLLHLAPLLLLTGNNEEYRELCERLFNAADQASEEDRPRISNWVVRMCGLDPGAAGDPDRVLRLAKDGLIPANDETTYFLYALGRAYYRAGDCEQAVAWLQKALEKATASKPLIYLDLALAHHLGGRHPEAREWLDKATQLLEQSNESRPNGHEGMEIEVLRREAELLIHAQGDELQSMKPRRNDMSSRLIIQTGQHGRKRQTSVVNDELEGEPRQLVAARPQNTYRLYEEILLRPRK